MTEEEWLAANDSGAMLKFLDGKVSARKARLFAVACSHRVYHRLSDEHSCKAFDIAEQYADGLVSEYERRTVFEMMLSAAGGVSDDSGNCHGLNLSQPQICVALAARRGDEWLSDLTGRALALPGLTTANTMLRIIEACERAEYLDLMDDVTTAGNMFSRMWQSVRRGWRDIRVEFTGRHNSSQERRFSEAYHQRIELIVDIFDNPFRPITLDPSWLTSTVVSLANQMYNARDFSAMPILADALQDAGCDNEDILNHCRSDGPHCRGCFVVDLLTGRK